MEQRTVMNKIGSAEAKAANVHKSVRKVEVPELYRLPIPDRAKQGCMKARA